MQELYSFFSQYRLQYPNLIRATFDCFFNLTDFLDLSEYGNSYCPFHGEVEGKSKPSAQFFRDEDGIERLWCFSERKQFTAYDYVTKILEQEPVSYMFKNFSKRDIIETAKYLINNPESCIYQAKSKLAKFDYKGMSVSDFVHLISFGEVKNG